MSELVAYAGGILLVGATVPQAVRLWRTRRADDTTPAFAALNLAGILLLAPRSAEIGEAAFLAINLVTAAFWAAVAFIKFRPVSPATATAAGAPT